MNAFEKFIVNKYDVHERHDIMVHGVANYAPHGLIYYSETEALYKVYKDDLHEIMDEYMINGTKLTGFRTLKTRANQLETKTQILQDIDKIKQFREKANSEK